MSFDTHDTYTARFFGHFLRNSIIILGHAFTQGTRSGGDIDADLEKVYAYFPRLMERRRQIAGTLSGGEQQMLAMGRALMSRPKLLMLDEPSMGLAPILV